MQKLRESILKAGGIASRRREYQNKLRKFPFMWEVDSVTKSDGERTFFLTPRRELSQTEQARLQKNGYILYKTIGVLPQLDVERTKIRKFREMVLKSEAQTKDRNERITHICETITSIPTSWVSRCVWDDTVGQLHFFMGPPIHDNDHHLIMESLTKNGYTSYKYDGVYPKTLDEIHFVGVYEDHIHNMIINVQNAVWERGAKQFQDNPTDIRITGFYVAIDRTTYNSLRDIGRSFSTLLNTLIFKPESGIHVDSVTDHITPDKVNLYVTVKPNDFLAYARTQND